MRWRAACCASTARKLGLDANISNHGLDSMMAIELKNRLEQSLKVGVAIVDLLRGMSAADIAGLVLTQLRDQQLWRRIRRARRHHRQS